MPKTLSPAATSLREADSVLGRLIDTIGPLSVTPAANRFADLAGSIVSQQLSSKAASTIWGRFAALGPVTPEAILELTVEAMRGAGLSGAKVRYVRDLAEKVRDGDVDLHGLDHLSDDDVIEAITKVKGVGRWTAEMFLIFVLARPDVLALDDAGLRRAAGWVLGCEGPASGDELAVAGERWRPYRSTASLYLWGAIDRGMVKAEPRS